MSKNKTILVTAGAFFGFFLFGVLDNVKGSAIPSIMRDVHITYSAMGTILFFEYVGFFTATLIGGYLLYTLSKKRVIIIAFIFIFAGLSLFCGFPVFLIMTVSFIIFGFGLGTLEIVSNTIMVCFHHKNKGMFLNLLSFFYGIGAMAVPVYAGNLLALHYSWRIVFGFCVIPVLIILLYFIIIPFPKENITHKTSENYFGIIRKAFKTDMILFYISICFYVAAEIGVSSWLVEYLEKIKSFTVINSSLYLSLYFTTITAGRLIGSFLVDKIGHVKIMTVSSFCAVLSLVLGIFGPKPFTFFLPITGFFFSIIFPTIIAAFSEIKEKNIDKYLGILFTFAGIGGMIGPWLIGLLSEYAGIGSGLILLIAFCTVMFSSLALLTIRKKLSMITQ